MKDDTKTCLGSFLMIAQFVFALVGFIVGWIAWDLKTGIIIAMVTFAVFFLITGITFATIDKPSVWAASMPMILSMVYTLAPDIPGPFDDAFVQAFGGALSYLLWLKRDPDHFPKWAILPLLGTSAYDLLGAVLPGPIDELLVDAISVGSVIYGYNNNLPQTLKLFGKSQ